MNVVKVLGGLGNQLFQYAFGKAQMLNGIDVAFELAFYNGEKQKWPRVYQLDKFNINVNKHAFLRQPTIKDHEHGFDINLLKLDNHNFDGYWQFLGYYNNIIPVLRKEFIVHTELWNVQSCAIKEDILDDPNSIAIHVRRGDYLVQTWGILPFKYYFEALEYIPDKGCVYIFSDDPKWCEEHFKREYFGDQGMEIMNYGYDACIDFELMKSCKHQIIGSSTFSWWAAFLNNNPNKIVVAPDKWLGGTLDNNLIYPKEWIKIKI